MKLNINPPSYSFVLALLSFLAIMVSFFMLVEMRNQRALATEPVVLPERDRSYFIRTDSICPENVVTENLYRIHRVKDSTQEKIESIKIDFVNVGRGSAVHLEFEWDMNFERFKELLEKFEIDSTIFKLRLYHPDFFGYNYQNCAEGNYSFSTFRDMKIDYSHLLPSIEDKEGISVHIPYYALPIHLAIIKANFMQNGINSRTVVHTNEYKVDHLLTVTYESVYGKKYKQKYIVSIEISFPLVSNSGSDTPSIPTWNDFVIWISTTPI